MRFYWVEMEYRQLAPLTFKSNCAAAVQKMSVYPPKRACLLPRFLLMREPSVR